MKYTTAGGRQFRRGRSLGRRQAALILMEALEPRTLLSGNVPTFHADALSTGNYSGETVLTPGNVNSTDFGRQFITALDGQVWAQPLTMENVNITRGSSLGVHNVIYVATMHDSLFAVDADTGAILWQDSFLQISDPRVTTTLNPVPTTGVTSFPEGVTITGIGVVEAGNDVFAAAPEIGIFGTPYIDASRGILYCVTSTQEWRTDTTTSSTPTANGTASGTDWHYVFRIWAVNLSDGSVAITPAAPTTGAPVPASGGAVIADTVLNATASSHAPPFAKYTGYEYYAGPWIRATGDNAVQTNYPTGNVDGWATNPNDTSSVFAGTYPTAQSDLAFNSLVEGQRTGMAMLNGVLYLSFTSHGDKGPYYGWVIGVNASTLQTQAAFVTTPSYTPWSVVTGNSAFSNGSTPYDAQGSIWGGEQGVITDGTYLYMAVGNGDFNWTPGNFSSNYYATEVGGQHVMLPIDGNYGDSYIKLAVDPNANQSSLNLNNWPTTYSPDGQNPNGYGLSVIDYFTPSDLLIRNYYDWDVGSSGIVMFPNSVTSTVPGHVGDPMMAAATKEGRIYLMDRNNMGGFNTNYFIQNGTQFEYASGAAVFNASNVPQPGPNPVNYDQVLGQYVYGGLNYATDGIGGKQDTLITPTFLMNGTTPTFYTDSNGGNLLSFNINTFQYTTFPTQITTASTSTFINPTPLSSSTQTFGNDGATPVTSSNGTNSGIVWLIQSNNNSTTDNIEAFAANGTQQIFTSTTNQTANSLTALGTLTGLNHAEATKMGQPIVFNGMVYAGIGGGWGSTNNTYAQGAIVGYGLLSTYLTSNPSFFGAPTGLAGRYYSGTGITLTWTRNSTLETHTKIERSSDRTTWTVIGYTDNGANSYTDATAQSGQSYFYRVSAINGASATAVSNTSQITATPPVLQSAVSRKTQGAAGTFDIALPLSGAPGIEDRSDGPTLVVLTFAGSVTLGANYSVGLSTGTAGTSQVSATTLSIHLSGATDGQTLVVTVNNLQDAATGAAGNYTFQVGILLGDINTTGAVNGADITLAKLGSGQPVTASNFRYDINGDGAINGADITLTELTSGDSLAAAPALVPSVQTPSPSTIPAIVGTRSGSPTSPTAGGIGAPGVSAGALLAVFTPPAITTTWTIPIALSANLGTVKTNAGNKPHLPLPRKTLPAHASKTPSKLVVQKAASAGAAGSPALPDSIGAFIDNKRPDLWPWNWMAS